MDTIFRDLRYSVRMLLKSPGFAAVAVLSIALGIGANTAVFSVINAVLLKSLPYKDPSSLMLVWGDTRTEGNLKGRNQVSWTDVSDFRKQATSFEDVAAYKGWFPIMSGDSAPERLPAIQVGDGYFKIMKGEPILGRAFTPEEQEDGKDFVIVLGHGLWQRRFGGDPNIVGRSIELNSRSYTIVGVMGPDFHPLPTTLVSPEGQFYRPVAETYDESQRDARHLRAIARLKPGVTLAQAGAEMNVIAQRLEREHPLTNHGYGVNVVSITDDTIGGVRPTLLMIFGAVVFVLLVACANVANLLLARSTARHKEITIRAAIGAGRARLVRQLLTESLLLAICGGALGLLLATWGVGFIEVFGAKINPMFNGIRIDMLTLAFTLGLSIVTALLFGLAPALQISKPNLTESLKEGGRSGSASAGRNRLRSALVVSEIALTLVLLVSAGLLIRTVARLSKVDKGFN
ncbi:MAG TPA: ABC transporter permease, partial [Pyrinomonadaceae bacterium]